MSIEALALPKFSREKVARSNLVLNHEFRWRVDGQENEGPESLSIRGFTRAQVVPNKSLCLDLKHRDNPRCSWKIYIGYDEASEILRYWLQGANVKELPDNLVFAAAELCLEHITKLEPNLKNYYIETLSKKTEQDEKTLSKSKTVLAACIETATHTMNAYCDLPDSILIDFLKNYGYKKNRTQNLHLPISFLLGESDLSAKAIKGLETGDILLFSRSYLEKNQCLICLNGRAHWLAEIEGEKITLLQNRNLTMTEADETKPISENVTAISKEIGSEGKGDGKEEGAKLTRVDELPMSIRFLLPGETMALEDVQTLTAGHVFTLEQNASTRVIIEINQRKFAYGQLVNIEGRLGVQITESEDHGN